MTKKLQKEQIKELQYLSTYEDPDEYWGTFDLGVSIALSCKKFVLVHLNKENPKKVQFVFEKKEGIEKVADDYWNGKLKVNAREFFDTMRALKNRIHE